MTKLLSGLLYDYGLLHVTLASLEEARAQWSQRFGQVMSQEDLDATPIAADEPVLVVVRKSDAEEPSFHHPGDHAFQAIDANGISHTENISVLELPFDEYHFFSAFRPGIQGLTEELPNFFFGMAVVHAYGLFENYMVSLLRSIVVRRPEMLGNSKQVTYGEVIECHPSMDKLIERLAEKHIHELSYKSLRDQLKALRAQLGFRDLADEFDDEIVEVALFRNCLVHNRGVADQKLAEEFPESYAEGSAIVADKALVDKTIVTCRRFAVVLDAKAEEVHSIR